MKKSLIQKIVTSNKILASSLGLSLSMLVATVSAQNLKDTDTVEPKTEIAAPVVQELITDTIIVSGGCFWCVESDFEKYPGVIGAVSGYTGGTTENPTYEQVSSKKTGHIEAVKITFDTSKTTAKELIEYFWATIDPTEEDGQFCDKGEPYKSALFYQSEDQKKIFENSLAYLKENKPFEGTIATEIISASTFYNAEEYHQDYYKKSPLRYSFYRKSCGRDSRIKKLWGKVASKEIKKYNKKK